MAELTRAEKIATYHIWRRALSEDRVNLTRAFVTAHPGVIKDTLEWSDLLTIGRETIRAILAN